MQTISILTRRTCQTFFISEIFRRPAFEGRTPGPPPFSAMNSTPAASRARRPVKAIRSKNGVAAVLVDKPNSVPLPSLQSDKAARGDRQEFSNLH